MVVLSVVIPDDVDHYVVTYDFANWTGSISKRSNFYHLVYALMKYHAGVKYIGASEDYEKVGLYYVNPGDKRLHLIQSYDTIWGVIYAGEQV